MFCEKCGAKVSEGINNCTNCGTPITNNSEGKREEIRTTGLLVWSILELCCINFFTGIIAIILYFAMLRPAVEKGAINDALKSKKIIKIVLWIGIGLSIIVVIGFIVLLGITVILPIANSTQDLNNSNLDRLESLESYIQSGDRYNNYEYYYDDYEF